MSLVRIKKKKIITKIKFTMEIILKNFNSLMGSFGGAISALIIIIIGWFIAGLIKRLVKKLAHKSGVDSTLRSDKIEISTLISKLVYMLIMIFVFVFALDKLGLGSTLEPLKNMLDEFTGYLPNIFGAGLVGYIGYMLANIVSELVGLSGDTIKSLSPKLKLPENIDLVSILKKNVFIFIFIPMLIAALNILNMDAISVPATAMLQDFFSAIPRILVAIIIIVLFVVGGRFLSGFVKDLLDSFNLNSVLKKASLSGDTLSSINFSKVIGNIVYFFIVIFGIMTAIEKLEFIQLTTIIKTVITYASKILIGLVILGVGNWIANLASSSFAKGTDNKFVASVIKIAILAIFLAMGLKTMGLADEIVNLAFGITLGTIAVTIALSFGLGGREAAGKQMSKIIDKFNKK